MAITLINTSEHPDCDRNIWPQVLYHQLYVEMKHMSE